VTRKAGAEFAAAAQRRYADVPLSRAPLIVHDEYLGRVLARAVGQARLILTPARSAGSWLTRCRPPAPQRVVNWGVDYLVGHSANASRRLPRPYLLYVGPARRP